MLKFLTLFIGSITLISSSSSLSSLSPSLSLTQPQLCNENEVFRYLSNCVMIGGNNVEKTKEEILSTIRNHPELSCSCLDKVPKLFPLCVEGKFENIVKSEDCFRFGTQSVEIINRDRGDDHDHDRDGDRDNDNGDSSGDRGDRNDGSPDDQGDRDGIEDGRKDGDEDSNPNDGNGRDGDHGGGNNGDHDGGNGSNDDPCQDPEDPDHGDNNENDGKQPPADEQKPPKDDGDEQSPEKTSDSEESSENPSRISTSQLVLLSIGCTIFGTLFFGILINIIRLSHRERTVPMIAEAMSVPMVASHLTIVVNETESEGINHLVMAHPVPHEIDIDIENNVY